MNEEKETVPENPEHEAQIEEQADEPHKEHQPPKQRSGGSGAFIAILLSLGALGGGYYLWQQQKIANADTRALKEQIGQLNTRMEQSQQTLLQRMQTVPKHQHPELAQRLAKMESALFELRNRIGQQRRGWQVAEVEYLLRIADDRLRLEKDVDTAIAALQGARQRLQSLDSSAFNPVITLIGSDIEALAAVKMPDRDALATKVANLGFTIEQLPLTTAARPKATATNDGEAAPADAGDKRSLWQRLWHDIRSLVTIRHDGEAAHELMVPEERYFLRQNLQLKLEAARLALMAGNDASWKAALNQSIAWLQRYFDGSDPAVADAVSTLKQLSVVELNPPLPSLSDSRQMLQQAAMQMPAADNTPAADKQPTAEPTAPEKAADTNTADEAPVSEAPPAEKPSTTAPDSDGKAAAEPQNGDVPQLPQGTGQ